MEKTGIIILAAGNSSRLGQPKQLLPFKNSTLLKNTIAEASLIPNSTIIVVTGSNYEAIEKELKSFKTHISFNPDWELGMSSSIIAGINELLLLSPETKKCILSVCDQPFVTSSVFENLVNEYNKTGKGIIASSYAETLGTPALFDKKYFNELLGLKGQEGAKRIISKFLEDTVSIAFEKGNIDIDTEEDYNKLMSGI